MPEISEYLPGMRLDHATKLGVDTKLGSSGTGHHFTVTLNLNEEESTENNDTIRAIIDSQKPAHTFYTLQIIQNGRKRDDKGDA